MAEALGAPFMFVTFSPKVIENELCLEFAVYQDMEKKKKLFSLMLNGNVAERGLLLSSNPVAVSRAFEIMVQGFFEILVGHRSTKGRKTGAKCVPGVFGPISGGYGVHEVQGRGVLHMHALLFGNLDPTAVQAFAHNKELREFFCSVIDSMVCGSLRGHDDIRTDAAKTRKLKAEVFAAHRAKLKAQRNSSSQLDKEVSQTSDLFPPNQGIQVPLGLQKPVNPDEITDVMTERLVTGYGFREFEDGPFWSINTIIDDYAICDRLYDLGEATKDVEECKKNFTLKELELLYKRDCINKGGQEIAAHYNYHTHCFTCHKSSSNTKRYVCRLALPSRRSDKTKVVQLVEKPGSDGKVRVVEQSPPGSIDSPPVSGQNTLDARDPRALALVLRGDQESDGLQVETSLPMSNVLRCNIAAKPLGALSQALNAHHYLTNYFSKKTFDLANTLSLVRTAQVEAVKYPSEADDAGTEIRKTKHLLTKVVNKLSGSIEISDTQASMALLNYESYVSTHSFWFVYIWPALRFQMQLARDRGDVVAPLEIDASEEHGDDSDDEGDEGDAVEGLMEDRARLEDDRGYDNHDVLMT